MNNEEEYSGTSVLLPAAKVAVYTKDKDTVDVSRSLADDWRFARVEIFVEEGDVETAIDAYASMNSPDVVLVQTDEIGDDFALRLEALASNCSENTLAIVIGPDNDVYLYRKLIGMGVSDYLVKPVKQEILSEVLAKTLLEKIGASGSYLVAVIGSRGGQGASTVSRMLALGSSFLRNQKALLLDSAGGWSCNGISLGQEPSSTFSELVKAIDSGNEDALTRMMLKPGERLSMIATGADILLEHSPTADQAEKVVDNFMSKFPVVVFDLSQAPAPVAKSIISKASKIILVTSPAVISLRLARTLYHEVKELRGNSVDGVSLIINKLGQSPAGEMSKSDIQEAMEVKPSLVLPFEPKVFYGCEGQGKMLHEDKEGKGFVEQVVSLIDDIFSERTDASAVGEDPSKIAEGKKAILGLFHKKK